VWVHHSNDSAGSFGSKTREWEMDFVARLEKDERPEADIAFRMVFTKARSRSSDNRADFEDANIALVVDRWESSTSTTDRKRHITPMAEKALEALMNVLATDAATKRDGRPAARAEDWKAECAIQGLIDPEKKDSARSLFSKYRRELIAANRIACHNDLVWPL